MSAEKTAVKPRYRTPSASCYVSLDNFDNADIAKYLRHKGHTVDGINESQGCEDAKIDGMYLSPEDLDHINTLAVCGQIEQARKLTLEIVGEIIGRPL